MTATGPLAAAPDAPGGGWGREQLAELFAHCWVVARDRNAAIVPVAAPLGRPGGPADRPWSETTRDLHGPDRLALVRTWWATLDRPGEVHTVEVRLVVGAEWRRRRLSLLNLLDHPEWGQVLVGTEDLGATEPPPQPVARDQEDLARGHRPVWVLQELSALGIVLRTDGDVERIFGRPAHELEQRIVLDFIDPEDHAVGLDTWSELINEPGGLRSVEQRIVRPDGTRCWIESTLINRLDADGSGSVLSVCHDITERRAVERSLRDRARTDPLTGLANRAAVDGALRGILSRSGATVAFVDLDGFKSVNDDFGHAAGDAVLVALAGRLAGLADHGVLAGRWGGDEFVLVADATLGPPRLERLVLEVLVDPVVVDDGRWFPAASIGVVAARAGDDAAEVVRRADAAMYDAKPPR
jgi:diguanylate cyclase (GGDEF)-like protein/PAS domain S-box-containing protein